MAVLIWYFFRFFFVEMQLHLQHTDNASAGSKEPAKVDTQTNILPSDLAATHSVTDDCFTHLERVGCVLSVLILN